jgi:hypothetical protein
MNLYPNYNQEVVVPHLETHIQAMEFEIKLSLKKLPLEAIFFNGIDVSFMINFNNL